MIPDTVRPNWVKRMLELGYEMKDGVLVNARGEPLYHLAGAE